jgi:hypothetical protein
MVNIIKIYFLTFLTFFLPIISFASLPGEYKKKSQQIFFDGKELLMEGGVDSISLGNCKRDSVCASTFTVINKSDVTLLISNVRGSCGLSVPVWPRDEIHPGESGTVQIRFDSERIGVINRNLIIHSNTFSGSTVLKVVGKVLQAP